VEVQVSTLSEACQRFLRLNSDHDGLGISGTRRCSPDNKAMYTKFTTSDLQLIPPPLPATEHTQRKPLADWPSLNLFPKQAEICPKLYYVAGYVSHVGPLVMGHLALTMNQFSSACTPALVTSFLQPHCLTYVPRKSCPIF